MEQVHDKVRRESKTEILENLKNFKNSENQFLSRAAKQIEKRISKSTFWRMLGPNLRQIITSK